MTEHKMTTLSQTKRVTPTLKKFNRNKTEKISTQAQLPFDFK